MSHVLFSDACFVKEPIVLEKPEADFTAEGYYRGDRINIKLSDFLNRWVVLFFYANDFSFVWSTELAAVADHYEELKKLGAEVLAISTDSVYAHKIYAQISPSARKVQYPLLADPTHEISKCYGAYNPETGFATRTTLIISPKGLIKFFCKYLGPVGRNVNEIIRVIQALQFSEASGLGAPAGWVPGQPGIRRDWEMVGRV